MFGCTNPQDPGIRRMILEECHDIPIAGHLGRDKTLAAVTSTFFWPHLRRDVALYVQRCEVCQQVKASNQKTIGLHMPLEIPTRRWEQVHMDLITGLPLSRNGHDTILTVVDQLTRVAIFIPTTKSISAKGVARLFFDHVFWHYGMPSVIISDRDARFTSVFWQELMDLMGTNLRMSTAFHPQTDGMAERYNRTVEEMLRAYVHQINRDQWDDLLTPLEFAYNSSMNAVTGYSPFFLLYGLQPRVPKTFFRRNELPETADRYIKTIWKALRVARERIARVQLRQKQYVDQKRREQQFEVGDLVYLSTTNLSDTHLPKVPRKLWPKYIGPFEILKKVNANAYQLQLPEEFKMHNVFNVSQMKFYYPSLEAPSGSSPLTFFLQNLENPPVEEIIDRQGSGVTRQYLIKWKNQDEAHNTWVTPDKLKTVWQLVQEFNRRYEGQNRAQN